ncbi:hypothetical protein DFJ74DRAFT_703091 [Hyaloraphidium curvatum]|nr:hypothetical protein DFJ74DRAFT_703091 [Hyaloraphidium curvatum]
MDSDAPPALGLGLSIEDTSVPKPATPPPEMAAHPPRTPPPGSPALLAADSFPSRPPQSPRSPLRDHRQMHAGGGHGLHAHPHHSDAPGTPGHDAIEIVSMVIQEPDLLVPAITLAPGSPQPAVENAFFHEINEDPLQLSSPPSPFPRSPRRSPISSPVRHRSPISSPRPGHSPSPTAKLTWRAHNHHAALHASSDSLEAGMVTPSQLDANLSELLARTNVSEDDDATLRKQGADECATPDSDATVPDAVLATSLYFSRNETLDQPSSQPVKKDSGIDLTEDSEEAPSHASPPREVPAVPLHDIPQFYFKSAAEAEAAMDDGLKQRWSERTAEVQGIVDAIFTGSEETCITDPSALLAFTVMAIGLPRYFNANVWRLAETETHILDPTVEGVSREGIAAAWLTLRRACGKALLYDPIRDDASGFESRAEQPGGDAETVAFFATMDPARLHTAESRRAKRRREPERPEWIGWDDLELVVNDIVRNHPGLDFLRPLPIFQERYKDTILARLMYLKTDFWDGRMTLRQFKSTGFVRMVAELEENAELSASGQQAVGGVGDVNTTRDIFSYKHFYVIYCRFWELDTDHDMVISGRELLKYDLGRLTRRTARRVMEAVGRFGKVAEGEDAKAKMEEVRALERNWFRSLPEGVDREEGWLDAKLEYRDFVWIVLLIEDKSVPSAISFWFRILDTDDDGILALHELRPFWEEQIKRMREGRTGIPDPRNPGMVPGYWCGEVWDWPDFLTNLMDLSHANASPCEGRISHTLPPACGPDGYEESYIHVTLPALRASNHAAHFFDLVFDLRSYDVHQRRMEPSFRESDDVWICDEDGNRKFKLRGWEKFSERQYEILANEERLQAQQQARRQAQEKRNTRRLLFNNNDGDANRAGRTLDDSGDEASGREDESPARRRRQII